MTDFEKIRRRVVIEVLTKYPDMKTRTMARLLQEQYPGMFPKVEHARSAIRYLRGTKGEKVKKYAIV